MSDLAGKRLGQYELLSILGTGGMAVVYKARQESMDREVAIKVIGGQLSADPDFIARFEREARLIAKLQHPHILPVYDFGRDEGRLFLVMRLVEGGSLDQRLRKGALPIQQTARMITGIASALTYAHDHGIVHRDLKPNNILLDTQDNPYLTDFGIAKAIQDGGESRLTATGTVMGTPSYMAPEQWRGELVDARTDIYALGVMLYEMLTGDLPFRGDTPYALMYKHFDQQPPSPHLLQPQLPEAVNDVLRKALAKNKNERYASANQLAEDLNAVLAGQTPRSINADDNMPTIVGGFEVPTQANVGNGTSLPERTAIGTSVGEIAAGTQAGRTKAGVTTPGSVVSEPVKSTSGRWPLVGAIAVIILLLIGGGAFLASQATTTANATATQMALVGQTATQAAIAASTGTAFALLPTHTPTATNTATLTPTEPLPTAVRFETYTDTANNIKFRYPSGWEVQGKQGYGLFITEHFADLKFDDKLPIVLGANYMMVAVGNSLTFGAEDMVKAKTPMDALTAFFGAERLQNLDPVYGTHFDAATTTRPRPQYGVVRTHYLLMLGPDRYAMVILQAKPEDIQGINAAITLPLVRSLDFATPPTKAVVPTDTPTVEVASTFVMPDQFGTFTSKSLKLSFEYPLDWTNLEDKQGIVLTSGSGTDVNNPDSPPYIIVFKQTQADIKGYAPEVSIVDLFRDNLGAMAQNPEEIEGVPYPTAIGRSFAKSLVKVNGWLLFVQLDTDNYLTIFAQAPRGQEDEYREKILLPLLKSMKYGK